MFVYNLLEAVSAKILQQSKCRPWKRIHCKKLPRTSPSLTLPAVEPPHHKTSSYTPDTNRNEEGREAEGKIWKVMGEEEVEPWV
jgi:hypothetical protein